MRLRDGGRRARPVVPLAIVAGFAVVALVLGTRAGGTSSPPAGSSASSWRGLVGDPRPPAAVGQRMIVVLRSPSLADRVAGAGGLATDSQERRWTAEAYAAQKQLIADLGSHGLQVAIEYSYARVLNGFSAALDVRATALLERSADVAGVYPVRTTYPAAVSTAAGSVAGTGASLPGFDGRGVTIALLDTGVDRGRRFLGGHVLEGIDLHGAGPGALARANPEQPGDRERHGTQMAGILVGSGGPAGARGVATGASVLPIRVAGWELDAHGQPAVLGRTDQLIAGLERAVDPNDDGDAHDAARIILLALSEPYAAFADSPEARAVGGALRLDSLVVAAAGNDGPAGPAYGSISGPGGAAGALTVGAADLRPRTSMARVALRTGLHVAFDRPVPLAGAVEPRRRVEGPIAAPPGAQGETGALTGLFDRHGFSLVAGHVALLAAGADPAAAAERAARAGALAVILYGRSVPGGSIGLEAGIDVPVVSIPSGAARSMLAAIRAGRPAVASIGAPEVVRNRFAGRVASFSSRGLAFAGRLKPDLVASGVSVLTSEPQERDGAPSFTSVSGSSAAAAVVAGAAAVLAQARPSLSAAELRSVLIGTARPVGPDSAAAQGAGLVDLGGASAAELAVEPPTLALGMALHAGRTFRRTIALRSLSPRPLRVFVGSRLEGRGGELVTVTTPARRVTLPPHGTVRVPVQVRVDRVPASRAPVLGALLLSASGGDTVRTPLTLTFAPARPGLIRGAALAVPAFRPSDVNPTPLTISAGRVAGATAPRLQPVERLDLRLSTRAGRELGLLARLRDLLPGRYVFGLTGRGPAGAVLPPGAYRLKIVAIPTGGGPPSLKGVEFRIK